MSLHCGRRVISGRSGQADPRMHGSVPRCRREHSCGAPRGGAICEPKHKATRLKFSLERRGMRLPQVHGHIDQYAAAIQRLAAEPRSAAVGWAKVRGSVPRNT
jgi:hypothetical protein